MTKTTNTNEIYYAVEIMDNQTNESTYVLSHNQHKHGIEIEYTDDIYNATWEAERDSAEKLIDILKILYTTLEKDGYSFRVNKITIEKNPNN